MFSRATQTWFDSSFPAPTDVQRRGWEVIRGRGHALLVAPTGSGKTLAAFLAAIDSLATAAPDRAPGVRVLYVSPLKALVYDVERNLRAPLAGIRRTSERLGVAVPSIEVAVRTGDTPARERRRLLREPGDILVTTPESLFLLVGSQARAVLRTVDTIILDEVHALAPTKRGAHLALTLERLAAITERDPQRIGLSATVRPLDEMARWVGGDRAVQIVDASRLPALDLEIRVPTADMTAPGDSPLAPPETPGGSIFRDMGDSRAQVASPERGIWPTIYPRLLEEIRAGRSTIVFVNSRGLCERLAQRLNDLAGEELVRAHHGSVSHEKRAEIEDGLKAGRIRGIVATSSLELGIDMGAVDRVLMVESPGSVARGLQRVGRAGHGVGETSVGRLYPKSRGDLLESAVVAGKMLRAEIEAVSLPRNVLDVLSQQIVAMCLDADRSVDEIGEIVRRAHPYRELGAASLEAVLDMLSGRYPSEDFADLRPLLSWDRTANTLSARRGAALVSRTNAGTIPDRGTFSVNLAAAGTRVGELDEEMVHETRAGDAILLGATSWRVEEIGRDRVLVSPIPGEPARLPFWKGEGPGRPIEVGRAIGAFLRELGEVPPERAPEWIRERSPLDENAARNLADYVHEQREHGGLLPTDRTICVERFRDELGDWRVCILTPYGARIHAPWAMAIQRSCSARSGFEVQVMYSDDGIVLRFADADEPPPIEALLPDPEELEELITDQLADTALFAGLFRENSVRSLLLPRRRPGQRNPLWAQRIKAQQLLGSVRRYPSFPIVLETYRQALRDVFDLPALKEVLLGARSRAIRVVEAETASASPFARSLVYSYVAAYMYDQDAPIAERRAQALTVDPALLRELLGQAELRELIDADVLSELEESLQHLAEERRARDADETHDLLRRLGDLSPREIAERATEDPAAWLTRLQRERRAFPLTIAGQTRWIAAEDAGLYRDALGVVPPAGLPATFLEPVPLPLERLLRRWARQHGPFLERDPAARWGITAGQIEPCLRALLAEGVLVHGEIRPGGAERDWCDAEVLRRLKRGTVARLRHQAAPVDARTLGAFLPRWHGLDRKTGGNDRLLEALAQLEGLTLPWSELKNSILPARVSGFRVEQLDALSTTGEVYWIGRGALGPRDGKVAIGLAGHASFLNEPEDVAEPTPVERAVLDVLAERGASFAVAIESDVRARVPDATGADFRAALESLAWAGRVTNDTFGALEAFVRTPRGDTAVMDRRRGLRRRASAVTGRWSRVESVTGPIAPSTERALSLAHSLLERYGVVTRECAQAEGWPGGFASVYRVLRGLEETGRVRRGYFAEGLSGTQFAHPAAVDRLRAARPEDADERDRTPDDVVVLATIDPANPWGALLPWPGDVDRSVRPRRAAGTWTLLLDGWPALWLGSRHVVVMPPPGRDAEETIAIAAPALRRIPTTSRRRVRIEKIDGLAWSESPLVPAFRRAGYTPTYRGLSDTGAP